jgi:hypothetical protein
VSAVVLAMRKLGDVMYVPVVKVQTVQHHHRPIQTNHWMLSAPGGNREFKYRNVLMTFSISVLEPELLLL